MSDAFRDPGDPFLDAVRMMPRRGRATPRMVDLSFDASLSWPQDHWYVAQNWREFVAQQAVASARIQGLPDRVQDGVAVSKVAVLLRARRAI